MTALIKGASQKGLSAILASRRCLSLKPLEPFCSTRHQFGFPVLGRRSPLFFTGKQGRGPTAGCVSAGA